MPDDRDFICFGTPVPERTLDEVAWEAELDLLGGYTGLVTRILREHVGHLRRLRRPSATGGLDDILYRLLDEWQRTGRLRSGYPGLIQSVRCSPDTHGNGVHLEITIFECVRPVTTTIESRIWFSKGEPMVESRVKERARQDDPLY